MIGGGGREWGKWRGEGGRREEGDLGDLTKVISVTSAKMRKRRNMRKWERQKKCKLSDFGKYNALTLRICQVTIFSLTPKKRRSATFFTHVDRERMIFSSQSRSSWRARLKQMRES